MSKAVYFKSPKLQRLLDARAAQPAVVVPVSKKRKSLKKALTIAKRFNRPAGKNLFSMFPPRKFTIMTWTANHQLTTNTTVVGQFGTEVVYRLNSIFEPQQTIGNTYRPKGYDQLVGIYNKYRVYGCKVTLKFYDPDDEAISVVCQLQASKEEDVTTGQGIQTQGMERWTVIKPIAQTGSQSWTYKRYANIRAMDGLTRIQMECSEPHSALINANPDFTPYLRFAALCQNGLSKHIRVATRLDYYVQLFDRQLMAPSPVA